MINKKEFDLLLKEIFQIENKIEEMKILNHFDKASEYNNKLEEIKNKAKNIDLDNENNSQGFDENSLNVLYELILLDSDVDYYVLKSNNVIASAEENKIDSEALKNIKKLWETLEGDIKNWETTTHNPIKEIEHNKQIGKIALDIIIYKLQIEAVLDLSEIFKYCQKEFLINAIKEVLYEGAKNEQKDEIRRKMLIDWAQKMSERELYNYKLWQEILIIKDVRSRDDHLEIIGNILEKDNRKYVIDEKKEKNKSLEEQDLELYYDDSLLETIKKWFIHFSENANQKRMFLNWKTSSGPAFKAKLADGSTKFAKEYLEKDIIENVKKLTIATDGVAKYHFEKNVKFKELEEIEILEGKITSGVSLSPDKTYKCIGNGTFEGAEKLKTVNFGRIEMIGERAFKDCKGLSTIKFSTALKNIGENAFLNCEGITRVELLGDLQLFILDRPQNILNCFKGTNLEEIVFPNIDSAFNFAITDCPKLKRILVSNIPGIQIPFKTCKYRLGRQEGIVAFVGEKSLNLWKKKNSTVRFFELTSEDIKKYKIS